MKTSSALLLTVAGIGLSMAIGETAAAAVDPVAKCEAAKMAAAGKNADAVLKCHAKAVTKGVAVDAGCVQKADDKLLGSYTKAEKNVACPAVGDAPNMAGVVDSFTADIVAALPPGTAGAKCAGKKLKAAGKRTSSMLKALAKDRKKGDAAKLAAALTKADEKFVKAFDGVEHKLTCETTLDACTIPVPIDDFVEAASRVRLSGCPGQLLYNTEGNRMRRYDIDTIGYLDLVQDVFIERASLDPTNGRDVNGPICAVPGGSGEFICGEDTGQPATPAGWGMFDASGTQIGKNTATYYRDPGEPFSCSFAANGNLFTTSIGDQPIGNNGQLILWFPPYDEFPGSPGQYPNTTDTSPNFCKIAVDLIIAGNVLVGSDGSVYVAQSLGSRVTRFDPPFPTSPDGAGGCGSFDALDSPLADSVTRTENFIADGPNVPTPAALAETSAGTLLVGSVFNGVIAEYDTAGNFIRRIVEPPAGETTIPYSTGHPQSMLIDCKGDLYYTDMNLTQGTGIGPGPNGAVRRVRFDRCGEPMAPELVRDGLAFPDGLGLFDGDLEGP